MLVFEATTATQGHRSSDYHFAWEHELVYLPFQECMNPECGCTWGFAGLESRRATTTARVVDRADLTIQVLCRKLAMALFEDGWLTTPDAADPLIAELANEITELATHYGQLFGVGTVIERQGNEVKARLWTAA